MEVFSTDPNFERVSRELAKYIDLAITTPPQHQPFDLADPEKPHYLRIYSAEAIALARSALRLSTGSDSLKDVTAEQFERILRNLCNAVAHVDPPQAGTNARPASTGATATPNSQGSTLVNDSDSEEADDDDEYDDSDDSDDWVDDDSELDTPMTDEEFLDPVSDAEDTTSGFEYDKFDHDYFYDQWKQNEAKEDLPADIIGPLLSNWQTRRVTTDILKEVFAISEGENKQIKSDVEKILRYLRLHYRTAHTRPFRLTSAPPYKGEMTRLIDTYKFFGTAGYTPRSWHRVLLTIDHPEVNMKEMLPALKSGLRDLRLANELGHLPGFQDIVIKRSWICHYRLVRYVQAFHMGIIIMMKYHELFAEAPSPHLVFHVNHDKAPELLQAVQDLATFDEEKLGKHYYPEIPGGLVKLCGLIKTLDTIAGCRYIKEFRENEDVKNAARLAGGLLRKWQERARNTKNSLFVELDSYDPVPATPTA